MTEEEEVEAVVPVEAAAPAGAVVQAEVAAPVEAAVTAAVSEETPGPVKCTRRPAPTAGTNAKFLSSRLKEGQSIAESASRNTGGSESGKRSIFFLFIFFIYLQHFPIHIHGLPGLPQKRFKKVRRL